MNSLLTLLLLFLHFLVVYKNWTCFRNRVSFEMRSLALSIQGGFWINSLHQFFFVPCPEREWSFTWFRNLYTFLFDFFPSLFICCHNWFVLRLKYFGRNWLAPKSLLECFLFLLLFSLNHHFNFALSDWFRANFITNIKCKWLRYSHPIPSFFPTLHFRTINIIPKLLGRISSYSNWLYSSFVLLSFIIARFWILWRFILHLLYF